ncbi:hypothetical protein E4U42_002657 [Claviceps africana]|uniref:Histone chaperone RTT106/FACT complex subunit SPT16-like middle domain-containing protein n=1 Tax=Claviceps africana TaxID=83212 RepID=A0A8K0NJE9_9HYPO|nr:hypothetical protein E4U42_002657 [Claviceps africana]
MSSTVLECQKLDLVFQSRPDIIEGIKKAADSPARVALFNDIANHVYDQLQLNGEPALKRRKVDAPQPETKVNGAQQAPVASGNAGSEPILLRIKEISVSVPQRKKFELCFTQSFVYARAPGTTAPIPQICYAWQDIEYIFYLPIPDKAQVQFNYILFPKGSSLPSKTNPSVVEPLVFTVPATAPKEGILDGSEAPAAAAVSDTFKSLFHWALERRLRAAGNPIGIVSADPSKFHSAVRQPQRPTEKAVHVSGFRGSKDGYLFFLENGILWGFKKPLIFIPMSRVAAISYTNILQITFNMVVEVFASDGEPNEELEFGMLDQQDYGAIDDFVKRNGLQDRSMAEQRKAKLQLAENRASKKGSDGTQPDDAAAGADDKTELEKAHLEAEQQMQDDEDEDEEDYDPGSDGDSDGSGESSEDGEGDEHDEHDEEEEEEEDEEDQEDQGRDDKVEHPHRQDHKATAEPSQTPAKPPPTHQLPSRAPAQAWTALRNPQPRDVDMDDRFDVA